VGCDLDTSDCRFWHKDTLLLWNNLEVRKEYMMKQTRRRSADPTFFHKKKKKKKKKKKRKPGLGSPRALLCPRPALSSRNIVLLVFSTRFPTFYSSIPP
jgi:hypothetical protein